MSMFTVTDTRAQFLVTDAAAAKVKALIEIQANNYYVRLFDKNWTILEAINKA